MPRNVLRPGSALIEALVALVLLASAGTGLISLLGQTARSMRSTLESERLTHSASAELDRLALFDGSEIRARLGRTTSHGWTVDITATSATLFDVRIALSDTGAVLLRTTLYRPRTDSANAIP